MPCSMRASPRTPTQGAFNRPFCATVGFAMMFATGDYTPRRDRSPPPPPPPFLVADLSLPPFAFLVAIPQVACETATKTGMVMVFGEITTKAKVDFEKPSSARFATTSVSPPRLSASTATTAASSSSSTRSPRRLARACTAWAPRRRGDRRRRQEHHVRLRHRRVKGVRRVQGQVHAHDAHARQRHRLPPHRGSPERHLPVVKPDGKTQVTIEYKNEGGAMRPSACTPCSSPPSTTRR